MSETTATRHRRAAVAFADVVRSEAADAIDTIVLFGSAARDETEGRDSGVDLLVVVTDETNERVDELRHIAYDISIEYGVTLSVHARTREEYDSEADSLVRTAHREGEPV